jgi:hypothetical protein
LIKPNEFFPDGEARLWCDYSDEDEEDCIIEALAEKLARPRDADGKMTLSFTPNYGGVSAIRRFSVRPRCKADVVFGTKALKEGLKTNLKEREGNLAPEMLHTEGTPPMTILNTYSLNFSLLLDSKSSGWEPRSTPRSSRAITTTH